jgi:hypothetical protein
MKSFYSVVAESAPFSIAGARPLEYRRTSSVDATTTARIAIYEAPGAPPRVEEVAPRPVAEFIEALACRVHELIHNAGGDLPYTVVREVTENLIHAGFAEPVISILDEGSTVRFADQGPGIPEKDRAVLPGYTTAHGGMKAFIRGVGSGLPIVRDFLSLSGGTLLIEDNLGCGSVVTLSSRTTTRADITAAVSGTREAVSSQHSAAGVDPSPSLNPSARPRLTTRQTQVLALVLESGSAGPSLVARELNVGLSTAYRDLALLEELGLIEAEGGKRTVTEMGLCFLDELTAR